MHCDNNMASSSLLVAILRASHCRSLSNYASVPANNNLESRLCAKFSYICCNFSHIASTPGYCSRELKCNS